MSTNTPSENPPSPNLSTLILSVGSAAAMHMGLSPHPTTNKVEKNLELAQFNIDLLVTLKEKTEGNLTDEENTFLSSILRDLQGKFIEAKK